MMLKPRDPWDDDLDILSAENVNFAVETAGLGSRFGAALIDLLLQLLILSLLAYAANFIMDFLPNMDEVSKWVRAIVEGLGIIVLVTVTHGYSFFFEWLWDGQTPGKRWLGLRVLQIGGTPITAWDAMVRSVLRTVDFLPLFYGAGAMVVLLNDHNQRIGDLVAGTVVARERHEAGTKHILGIDVAAEAFLASCASPVGVTAVAMTDPAVVTAPISANGSGAPSAATLDSPAHRLSEQDIELVREFFLRRGKLKPLPRKRLAHSLACRLCTKLGQTSPSDVVAEHWLEDLARTLFSTAHSP